MAMPMLAGPGSIASVMLLVSQNNGLDRAFVIFGALLLVLLLPLGALLAAGPLMRIIGKKRQEVITRLLGVLLAALETEFVNVGVQASFTLGLGDKGAAGASRPPQFPGSRNILTTGVRSES